MRGQESPTYQPRAKSIPRGRKTALAAKAVTLPGYLEIERGAGGLGHALSALDLVQIAHDHGGDQGEADGDRGGQPMAAMVESVAICVADRLGDLDGRQRPVAADGAKHADHAILLEVRHTSAAWRDRYFVDAEDRGPAHGIAAICGAICCEADHAGFSEWVSRHSEGRPTVEDTRDGSDHAAAYQTAVIHFTNQTIMRPNAQTFTRFSQHPVGGLIQQLQSFNHSFTNNVLARLKNLAVESIRPGSGLNGVERLAAWAPILGMLPLLGGSVLFAGHAREAAATSRGLQWHCRGQRFDPVWLHHKIKDLAGNG